MVGGYKRVFGILIYLAYVYILVVVVVSIK